MKNVFFILALVCLIACEDDGVKMFNAESIQDLDLANIDGFWDAGIDINTSYFMGSLFETDTGFIDGISLTGGEKGVKCLSLDLGDSYQCDASAYR